jgi:hypothetical protein
MNKNLEYRLINDDELIHFVENNFEEDFVSMVKSMRLREMRANIWKIASIYF